jgi:putative FmdB family regulatory protein
LAPNSNTGEVAMPIYEYRCSSCGHKLEALQKLSDVPLSKCPSCNADALVKLVSAAGFQLKGSGWYATDFKGAAAKPAAAKGGADAKPEAGAPGEKASEGKAEAKPESKSETKAESGGGSTATAKGTGAPPAGA